jgi:hypothetical protein
VVQVASTFIHIHIFFFYSRYFVRNRCSCRWGVVVLLGHLLLEAQVTQLLGEIYSSNSIARRVLRVGLVRKGIARRHLLPTPLTIIMLEPVGLVRVPRAIHLVEFRTATSLIKFNRKKKLHGK